MGRQPYSIDSTNAYTHLAPRQRLERLNPVNEVQLLQQHLRPLLEVHGVKVKTFDANIRRKNLPAHVRDKFGAKLPHLLIVILMRL